MIYWLESSILSLNWIWILCCVPRCSKRLQNRIIFEPLFKTVAQNTEQNWIHVSISYEKSAVSNKRRNINSIIYLMKRFNRVEKLRILRKSQFSERNIANQLFCNKQFCNFVANRARILYGFVHYSNTNLYSYEMSHFDFK